MRLPTLEKLGSKIPANVDTEGSSPGFFRVIVSGHVDRIVIEAAYFEIFRPLLGDPTHRRSSTLMCLRSL